MTRLLAAVGQATAVTEFAVNYDVDNGGLLFALPALLSNGLLDSLNTFDFSEGFYRINDIFITIAFMILARVENINQLGEVSPGEWGKLLGIDRIPHPKTMRIKTDILSHGTNERNLDEWVAERSSAWMEETDNIIGRFYLDGHVRTYFGKTTKLPRRYVSRQHLCLRGMTDYWVNDQYGTPFFCVSTPFSKGLIEILQKEIIPRLLKEVPNQPSEEELYQNPNAYRFLIIFDREGYSMQLVKYLWDQYRIACQTYNKYPKEKWDEDDFIDVEVIHPFGNIEKTKIADKKIFNKANDFYYREVRQLTESGHQVSVVSMDYISKAEYIYSFMSARTSQENFFKYARHDYNIDTLSSYEKSEVDETETVINPEYRQLEKNLNSLRSKLARRTLKRRQLTLKENPTESERRKYEEKEGIITKEIQEFESDIEEKKKKRKLTDKYITVKELPEEFKFVKFHGGRKKFIDIIKMISYRAEIAMANIILPSLSIHDKDTVKAIIKSIFKTPANIIPDYSKKQLTVELHYSSTFKKDKTIRILMDFLNEAMFNFPGTNLRLFYKFVSK